MVRKWTQKNLQSSSDKIDVCDVRKLEVSEMGIN